MANDVTSANATAILTVDELYPSGVKLEQFSADNALTMSDDTIAEARMGVDGQMVAGYTPAIKTVNVILEPSSPSMKVFSDIYKASQTNRRVYKLALTLTLPAIGKTFNFVNGVMTQGKFAPDLGKTLQSQTFQISFEKVTESQSALSGGVLRL